MYLFVQLTFLSAFVPTNKYDLATAPALKNLSDREKDQKISRQCAKRYDSAECCAAELAGGWGGGS